MSNKCFYCEREFIPENYGTNKSCAQTIDHIIPISRRGNNSLGNKVNACLECNSLKASMTLDEFKQIVEILILKKVDYYKTIPKELFYTIIKNIFELEKYVKKAESSLYLKKYEHKKGDIPSTDELMPLLPISENIKLLLKKPTKKKRSLVGAHLERMSNLGFYENPIILNRDIIKENKEKKLFLSHQTEEQFELAKKHGWKFAKMLTEPEPNFHYAD